MTGVQAYDSNDKILNSYKFYELLRVGGINETKIKMKNKTIYYKLQVLPQLMKLDKMANMIGVFTGQSLLLQTDKLIGNVNYCMGFIKNEQNIYIPNTALKEDIRNITEDRKKIIAVLKKSINEKMYKDITYLKQNYQIADILKSKKINEVIDIENICSSDRNISKKIEEFNNS